MSSDSDSKKAGTAEGDEPQASLDKFAAEPVGDDDGGEESDTYDDFDHEEEKHSDYDEEDGSDDSDADSRPNKSSLTALLLSNPNGGHDADADANEDGDPEDDEDDDGDFQDDGAADANTAPELEPSSSKKRSIDDLVEHGDEEEARAKKTKT